MFKIAYMLTPVEFAGAEKSNLVFLRNVNRKRFDIQPILLIRPWERDNLFLKLMNESDYSINTIPVAIKPIDKGRDYLRVLRCVLYFYRILTKKSYDLVHTHGYFADIIATPACKMLGIPHITTCHGFIPSNEMRLYNALAKINYRFCQKIISVSSQIKDYLVESGINENRIMIIQNAIQNSYDENEFEKIRNNKRRQIDISDDTFLVGYVGRLSEEKGIRYLIKAASELKKKDKKFQIILVGEGPERKSLELLARSLKLDEEIQFAGFQNDVDVWLQAFDVFVLPSLTEGTPMALLEAMSLGIPVVASAVGDVPEIIENEVNGILLGPGNSIDLSQRLLWLSENQEIRKRLGNEARYTIKREFDAGEWCRKIEGVYDEIIEVKSSRARSCC